MSMFVYIPLFVMHDKKDVCSCVFICQCEALSRVSGRIVLLIPPESKMTIQPTELQINSW